MKTNRHINKVAVVGSGIMGSRIACHFANIGVEVLLLDIVPFDLTEEQLNDKKVRNSIVNDALKSTLKSLIVKNLILFVLIVTMAGKYLAYF